MTCTASTSRLILSLSTWRLHCKSALQIPERGQLTNMGRPPAGSVRCGGLHSHRKTLCTGFLDPSVCHCHLFCSKKLITGQSHMLVSTDHARPLSPYIQAPPHVNCECNANNFSIISSSKKHCQESFLVKVAKENKSLTSKISWISWKPTEKKEPIIQYSKRSAVRFEVC